VVQTVRSKYRAAFEAGLQVLCQSDSGGGRLPPLLPHIYGSAEYLGDSSAGLGPPDEAATGANSHLYSRSCRICGFCSAFYMPRTVERVIVDSPVCIRLLPCLPRTQYLMHPLVVVFA